MWLVTLAWQRTVASALRPHGLTHVQFVLMAGTWWLCREEEPPTQRRLAEHTGTDQMMASQVLRRLEGKGLVRRDGDRIDTRAKRVALTDVGSRLLECALPEVERADAEFFAPVDRPELLQLLTRLATHEEST